MVVCAAFDPGPGGSSRLMFGKGTLSLLHSNGSGLHNDVSLVGFAMRGEHATPRERESAPLFDLVCDF